MKLARIAVLWAEVRTLALPNTMYWPVSEHSVEFRVKPR